MSLIAAGTNTRGVEEGGDGDCQCPPMALGSLIVCDQCTLHGLGQADAYGLRRK
jgi:hypothetical protein